MNWSTYESLLWFFWSFHVYFLLNIRYFVYYVTGSDRQKTIEQLTKPIYNLAVRAYQCSGNDVWQQDDNIYSGIVDLPDYIFQELICWLERSKFNTRTGNHIEERPGLVNFSIVDAIWWSNLLLATGNHIKNYNFAHQLLHWEGLF